MNTTGGSEDDITVFTIVIPDNEFLEAKLEILRDRGLSLTHRLPASGSLSDDLLNVARIGALEAVEMYFYDRTRPLGYVSSSNEAQALRLLWRQLETTAAAAVRQTVAERLATVPAGPPGRRMIDTERLSSWLAAGGCALPAAFHVALFPDTGRGLAASGPVAAGSVFRLPRRFIFSVQIALQSELGPLYARLMQSPDTNPDGGLDLHQDGVLLLHLVHERHNVGSWFAPYLELLPAFVPNGAQLPAAALAELDGLPALHEVLEVRERLLELHQLLFPRLSQRYPQHFPESLFTYESFLWARAIFDSRAFQIQLDGHVCNCLLPFVDFMNTCPRPHVDGRGSFNVPLDAYEFRLLRPAAADTQVFLHYGSFGNREQLLQFGLFEAGNEHEAVPLWLEAPDDWAAERRAVAERWRLQPPALVRSGRLSPRLSAALRIALDPVLPADPFVAARPEVEAEVWGALRLALDALLDLVLQAHPEDRDPSEEQIARPVDAADPEHLEELAVRQVVAYRRAYVQLLQNALDQVAQQQAALHKEEPR